MGIPSTVSGVLCLSKMPAGETEMTAAQKKEHQGESYITNSDDIQTNQEGRKKPFNQTVLQVYVPIETQKTTEIILFYLPN